jgi:hypothetical protein
VVNNVNVTNNNVNVSRVSESEALQALKRLMDELNGTHAAQDAEAQAAEVEPPLALPPPKTTLELVTNSDLIAPPLNASAPEQRSTTQQYYDWMARNLDKPP